MAQTDETPAKRGKWKTAGILLLVPLALSGGGFYASYSGILPGLPKFGKGENVADSPAFLPLEPIIVTINTSGLPQQLRVEGHLEVEPENRQSVTSMMPRVMDTLNTYLRAVELGDISDPAALLRLRSQMLRRVQIVTGDGQVSDLLVTKFLVS